MVRKQSLRTDDEPGGGSLAVGGCALARRQLGQAPAPPASPAMGHSSAELS